MILEGKIIVQAPIQKLWEMLLEPATLQACVPGAEKIERLDEKTYDTVVMQKVGPIKVQFAMKVILTKIEPPTCIEMEGEGEDIGKAGRVVQKTTVCLQELAEGGVEISYKTDANIVGKLAMFGDRIMRAKAKQVEEEFTTALQEKLKGVSAQEPGAPSPVELPVPERAEVVAAYREEPAVVVSPVAPGTAPIQAAEAGKELVLETMFMTKQGRIGRVTLNRPHLLNAVNNQATLDLIAVADHIAADPELRVVVITGAGERSFSTGIDLKELSSGKIEQAYHHQFERALRTLETCDKIIIAAINGWCLGGALQLALACDVRIARSDSQMGLPAVKECLIPGMAVFRLPRFIGLGRAKRLILSGENITARQALDMGLVDYVFEPDEFAGKVEEVVSTFLKTASVGARQSKILTTQAFDYDHAVFIQRYFDAQIVATDSPDHAEAMAAYREGRDPVYG